MRVQPHSLSITTLMLAACASAATADAAGGTTAEDLASAIDAPDTWEALPVDVYGPENVHQKIDGRDQTYLNFGLVAMANVIFENADGSDGADVEIYDMGRPEHALGVFAQQHRTPNTEYADINGAEAVNLQTQLVCWVSRFYIKVDRLDRGAAKEDGGALLVELARQAIEVAPESVSAVELVSPLPQDGMAAHSAGFTHAAFLGSDALADVKHAEYEADGQPVELFLLSPGDPAAALEAVAEAEGETEELEVEGGIGLRFVRPWVGTIAMVRAGDFIVGAIDPREEDAPVTELLRELVRQLR